MVSREAQLNEFVLGVDSMVALKEQFVVFGGSAGAEFAFEFSSDLVQTADRKALNYCDWLSKTSEFQLYNDVGFAAVKFF